MDKCHRNGLQNLAFGGAFAFDKSLDKMILVELDFDSAIVQIVFFTACSAD